MTAPTLLARGFVSSLAINGETVNSITLALDGPVGDTHSGMTRQLSGHDGDYVRSSALRKGHEVFNWRSWTAISDDELDLIEEALGQTIPPGCLLENMIICGIPDFSRLPPTSRLVFPNRAEAGQPAEQAVLAVWEENGPCSTVGQRLEDHYGYEGLATRFVREAQGKRGVTGFVLSPGVVQPNDEVLVYPPVS